MKMENSRWEQIKAWIDSGDPLKDIHCDEGELIDYIFELREQLGKKDTEA